MSIPPEAVRELSVMTKNGLLVSGILITGVDRNVSLSLMKASSCSFSDLDVVVSPSNIHLGEVLCSFQFVDEGGDEGEWVGILNCMFIKVSIVLE